MAITKSPDTLINDLTALQTRIGTAGKLVIRDSAYIPLITFPLSSTAFGTPNSLTGAASLNGLPNTATIATSGTAAYYDFETAFSNTTGNTFSFSVSGSTFTATGHNFVNGNIVQFYTTGTLPTGISTATDYYVINVSGATLQVSTTYGGGAVTLSSSGSGILQVRNLVVVTGIVGANYVFTVTSSVLAAPYHNFSNGNIVQVSNSGGSLPSPLAINTNYYVINVSGSGSGATLQLSLTSGGSAITLSGGSGTHKIQNINTDLAIDSGSGADPLALTASSTISINTFFHTPL
jgi:hypothetical protein